MQVIPAWLPRSSFVSILCVVSAVLLLPGCNSNSGPFQYVPVRGKVVYEDGTPLPTGKVIFQSLAPPIGKAYPRAAGADLRPDGTFDSVTSHKPGDGLIPGKHRVSIIYATDAQGNSLVPKEYTDLTTTPLEIDTADSPLVIEVPKP